MYPSIEVEFLCRRSQSVTKLAKMAHGKCLRHAGWPSYWLSFSSDAVCFYAFSLFAMDTTTHFVWLSVNAGALAFGPVIWREQRRLWTKGTALSERQAEGQREQGRRKREELQHQAEEAERQHQTELRREAARQRGQAEEGREAQRQCQQGRDRAAEQCLTEECWRVLEVAPSATKDEIVRNYRRKIRQRMILSLSTHRFAGK